MLTYPQFSPEIVSIGPISLRWYGAMYFCGFVSAWLLGRSRARKGRVFTPAQFDDVLTFGILGVVLGGRLGYVLFYNPEYFISHPLEIFYVWQGGMSFHGGMLGVMLGQWLSGRRYGKSFFQTMDFMAPLVPPGLFFGRLGNFINGELWGKVTDAPWGLIFPGAGPLPRPTMAVSGVFSLGYGVLRFFVEFFRQPDAHLGYLAFNFVTMGMLLCLPMILLGITLLCLAYRKKSPE